MTEGINCHKFRLLTWISFISQFVYPVGGEGMGCIVVLARYKFQFIKST